MKNLIEQLKDNEKQLILMDSELRDLMLSMSQAHFLSLQDTSTIDDRQWSPVKADKWYVGENLYNVFRLRPDYEDDLEIVEHEIFGVESHLHFHYEGTRHSVGQAYDQPDFIGFLFDDGIVMGIPVKYSVPGQTSRGYYATYGDIKSGQALEHHAVAVLFRRSK